MKKKLNKFIDINNGKSAKNANSTNAYSKVQFNITKKDIVAERQQKSMEPKKAKRTLKYYNPNGDWNKKKKEKQVAENTIQMYYPPDK